MTKKTSSNQSGGEPFIGSVRGGRARWWECVCVCVGGGGVGGRGLVIEI